MTEDWYEFLPDRRAEVTVFLLDGRRARTGAKGTRFFKKYIAPNAGAKSVVADALARMPYVRTRWPHGTWARPSGLTADENEIVLPALMLAAGRSESEVDQIVKSRGEPT